MLLFMLFLFSVAAFVVAIFGALGIIIASYFTLRFIVKLTNK